MELDVYTLMYALFAALGIALVYVIAGNKMKQLMHRIHKTHHTDQATAA